MIFKNSKVYDVLKWIVLTGVNALVFLITGLGVLYHFDSSVIVGTITLVAETIGILIGVSSNAYKKNQNLPTSNDENGAA